MGTIATIRGGIWGLGALTAQQAVESVFPSSTITGGAGHNKQVWSQMLMSVQAGQMVNPEGQPAYVPGSGDCAKSTSSGPSENVKLVQMGTSLALTGINTAAILSTTVAAELAAIGITTTVLGAATLGISAIVGIFVMLSAHHAAAVAKEQTVLCHLVPAANNYLQIINQGVNSGQITPQTGIAALNSLYNDFSKAVSSIRQGSGPETSGSCNAACVYQAYLQAIVAEKASEYQDMIDAANASAASAAAAAAAASQAQVVTSTRPSTTTPAAAVPASSYASFYAPAAAAAPAASPGTSDFLPIAAALAAGFLLMRIL